MYKTRGEGGGGLRVYFLGHQYFRDWEMMMFLELEKEVWERDYTSRKPRMRNVREWKRIQGLSSGIY